MKPFTVCALIVGATLVSAGIIALKSKIEAESDRNQIKKLIAEFKSAGIPTNGIEIRGNLPKSQNAWTEIGPLLLNKNGAGTGIVYKTGISLDLVRAGDAKDIDLMDRYLAVNQEARNKIGAALDAKPAIQVPHDYDLGYDMLLPEYAAMKGVCKDFCLAAYRAGLQHDFATMRKQFDYSNHFAQYCYSQPEVIGGLVGVAIHKQMLLTGLRLYQNDKTLLPELTEYFTASHLEPQYNPGQKIRTEFVSQLVTTRRLDNPLMERRRYGWPLNKAFPLPTEQEVYKSAVTRYGDYIPETPVMRRLMRQRLEAWSPYLPNLKPEGKPIPVEDYGKLADFVPSMPPALQQLYSSSSFIPSQIYRAIVYPLANRDLTLALWKSLNLKAKTGKYPTSLSEIGIKVRQYGSNDTFIIEVDGNGIYIHGKELDEAGGVPAVWTAYPPRLDRQSSGSSSQQSSTKLAEYRAGKIDEMGRKK